VLAAFPVLNGHMGIKVVVMAAQVYTLSMGFFVRIK
jgi:hypothetical protein